MFTIVSSLAWISAIHQGNLCVDTPLVFPVTASEMAYALYLSQQAGISQGALWWPTSNESPECAVCMGHTFALLVTFYGYNRLLAITSPMLWS